MSSTQFFPIPPDLFASACRTVSEHVSQLPFLRSGVNVTGELVGVAMECLNAVPKKALSFTTLPGSSIDREDGLDRCIEERLHIPGKSAAPVIADVLCSAGIAERTVISDRFAHREQRGIRLLPAWTWHIASTMAPSIRLGGSPGADPGLSWMDVCPVCRTGILSRAEGKQLFGIPRTDFIIECSHCGAKFIPVGPAFRLVSIATIRDPLWKKHLDKTYTPEIWAAMARGSGQGADRPLTRTPTKKSESPPLPAAAVTLAQLKDGSIALPVTGKTLYFRPVPLQYTGSAREDAFARVQKTLEELLADERYSHLRSAVNVKYSRYLPMKTGLFLGHLKERFDPFYREFLNRSGDEKYGSFRAAESRETEKRGVLIVVVNRGLYHVINSRDPLSMTVNNRLGRIGPDDCLLSGDEERCRINALLSNYRKEAGLFFHALENEEERLALVQSIQGLVAGGRT